MQLLNATKMQTGYTIGVDSSGRESIVVAIKGTFNLPQYSNEKPELAEIQLPLIMADTFTGDAGFSAPVLEVDYAPIKPFCDVILLGGAYAPQAKPTNKVQVGLKLGDIAKTFMVVGERHWEASDTDIKSSDPLPFEYMPISYDNAFGGLDDFLENPKKHQTYMKNPIGKGYHAHGENQLIDTTPLANTEEVNQPIQSPHKNYQPMSFSPIGRHWESRSCYAGTYDDAWLEDQFPFLPKDFDNRYFQSAPRDQQIPYPVGDEEVILINLSTNGRTQFKLPIIDMPVIFFLKKGKKYKSKAVIDTIVLEPDKGIFTMTWRSSLPLRKNIFEVPQILVGKMTRGWWRARELGKKWYPSLAHVVNEKRAKAIEDQV
jgi:hypothetical protein